MDQVESGGAVSDRPWGAYGAGHECRALCCLSRPGAGLERCESANLGRECTFRGKRWGIDGAAEREECGRGGRGIRQRETHHASCFRTLRHAGLETIFLSFGDPSVFARRARGGRAHRDPGTELIGYVGEQTPEHKRWSINTFWWWTTNPRSRECCGLLFPATDMTFAWPTTARLRWKS